MNALKFLPALLAAVIASSALAAADGQVTGIQVAKYPGLDNSVTVTLHGTGRCKVRVYWYKAGTGIGASQDAPGIGGFPKTLVLRDIDDGSYKFVANGMSWADDRCDGRAETQYVLTRPVALQAGLPDPGRAKPAGAPMKSPCKEPGKQGISETKCDY